MRRGIPTRYRGYTFRSRLEAKWAVFFDSIGWRWGYEPADFSGWIPDFAIYGTGITYVEIKPVVAFPQSVADKVLNSGCKDEILILGQEVPLPSQFFPDSAFGWLREGGYDESENSEYWWEEAVLGRWSKGKGQIGFCHAYGSYHDRITGGYDGGHFGEFAIHPEEIAALWAAACNRTQWKGSL